MGGPPNFGPPSDQSIDDHLLLFDHYDANGLHLLSESPFSSAVRCIFEVIDSLYLFLLRIFVASFLEFLISNFVCHRKFVANVLIGLVGFALVWSNADRSELVVPLSVYFLCAILTILFELIPQQKGIVCSAFSVIFVSFCQLLYAAEDFNMIRGALMIASMKMISLAFDAEGNCGSDWHSSTPLQKVCSMFAFVFSPSSVLFGPPIQFAQFNEWTFRSVRSFGLFSLLMRSLHFALLLLSSLLFLWLSSCLIDPQSGFFPAHLSNWLFLHYLNAQSFRFSHFFVCYLASACAFLAGHPTVQITSWTSIEWPRSMAEVAVNWNKPMHSFLHKYVYRRAKLRLGAFPSLLLTFAVSSALHGFDFQMLAVLLSLAFFAFSETRLRDALALCFSACVRSRECSAGGCHHRYKKGRLSLVVVRLCFTLINIFLLIYLGAPFHGEGQFTGYSVEHLLSIWRDQFRFSGHLISLAFFIVSFVIPKESDKSVSKPNYDE